MQAAVIALLRDIQAAEGTALIFISHDLALLRHVADRIMVMYLGHVVEIGSRTQVFSPPYHPYTEALLNAVPTGDPDAAAKRVLLEGEAPSALSPPSGCPFQTRCAWKTRVPDDRCARERPALRDCASAANDGPDARPTDAPADAPPATPHQIACHLSAKQRAEMRSALPSR